MVSGGRKRDAGWVLCYLPRGTVRRAHRGGIVRTATLLSSGEVAGQRTLVTTRVDRSEKIRRSKGLFDDGEFERCYYWSFLLGEYTQPGLEVKMHRILMGPG